MREIDATTRKRDADLSRVQMARENEVEGRRLDMVDHVRKVAEQQAKVRPWIDEIM
jgi:hypothetical protein